MAKVVYCHPDTAREVREALGWLPSKSPGAERLPIYGVEIRESPHCPRFARRWEFPADPFVEYSEADEAWAKPVGFGRYVDTTDPWMGVVDEDAYRRNLFMPMHSPIFMSC
jgi:hypothetical protein